MPKRKNKSSGLVYSTELGRMCHNCGHAIDKCICRQKTAIPESDGVVRIGRETKGRKGKGVTTISGVPLNAIELKELAKEFKIKCGTGGTVKNSVIEIQGDHRDILLEELKKRGWTVKRSGG